MMESIMNGIICDSDTLNGSYNLALLQKHTELVAFQKITKDDLANLKYLHIFSSADSIRRSLEVRHGNTGCHFSRAHHWLLILGGEQEEVQQVLASCTESLLELDIRFSDLTGLTIENLTGLQVLKLQSAPELKQIKGINQLKHLQRLSINHCGICSIDLNILTSLEELHIKNCNVSLTPGRALRYLSLHGFHKDKLDLNRFDSLQELELSGSFEEILLEHELHALKVCRIPVSSLKSADFLRFMPALEVLMLTNCPLTRLPNLDCCPNLYVLNLENTRLTEVEGLPSDIECLDLSGTKIQSLPESIRQMEYLLVLKLNRLNLEELPLWLDELQLPVTVRGGQITEGITLYDTNVKGMDMSMFPVQPEMLRLWLETYHAEKLSDQKPFNEIKVVFLGDGEAGKSLVVRRLLNGGEHPSRGTFDGDSTPGVEIHHKTLELEDRMVRVHYWDFGGQEILHSLHRIFQTQRTVYVVVLNARNDTQDERAEFWLRCIRSFDDKLNRNARILFILNKTDQNPRASINLTALRQLYPSLPDVVMLSATKDSVKDFNEKLGNALKREIESLDNLRVCYPNSWYKAKLRLEQMDANMIDAATFDQICDQEGVEESDNLREAFRELLNDLGVCFWYRDTRREDDILLRPEWVTNAIYKVLFNRHTNVHNGIISFKELKNCICQEKGDAGKHRCVYRDMKYSETDVSYILEIMSSYKLSFTINKQLEFIPMLCDRNASPLVEEYADDPYAVEIWWQFKYLPDSLLFRLMVERYHELVGDHVWLTGALFRDATNKCSALVHRDGNALKIHVRSENVGYPAGVYRQSIEDSIKKILIADFPGLCQKPAHAVQIGTGYEFEGIERLLVYKVGSKRETFDCLRLEMGRRSEAAQFYSKGLEAFISAGEILEDAYSGRDAAQSLMIHDVLWACSTVQGNRLFRDTKEGRRENERNTYVRDILKKTYNLADQTLNGVSLNRNRAGELDLAIYRADGSPWAIIEALNHSSQRYWKEHLNRLLNHYNPHHLRTLFLVNYVQCKKDNFISIWRTYNELIPSYDPENYKTIPASYLPLSSYLKFSDAIKASQCTYECGEERSTVYHVFVHLTETQQP